MVTFLTLTKQFFLLLACTHPLKGAESVTYGDRGSNLPYTFGGADTTTLCKDVKGFFLEINIKPLFLPIQAFARLVTLRHIL